MMVLFCVLVFLWLFLLFCLIRVFISFEVYNGSSFWYCFGCVLCR